MPESAIQSGRDARRHATMLRISACAQRLTLERGLDGFTMDELAQAADVSRRTLFNYFPGKIDAVLGPIPELDASVLAEFHSGGPHGDLVDDVTVLAQSLMRIEGIGRQDFERAREVIVSDPRLIAAAHDRFSTLLEQYVEEIRIREGGDFDAARARIVITIHAVLLHSALEDFLSGAGELPELYAETVRRAREALAPSAHRTRQPATHPGVS